MWRIIVDELNLKSYFLLFLRKKVVFYSRMMRYQHWRVFLGVLDNELENNKLWKIAYYYLMEGIYTCR